MSMPPPGHDDGQPFPTPYLSGEIADRLIQEILDGFNREHLTPHQARLVLDRVRGLIDAGELIARMRSH